MAVLTSTHNLCFEQKYEKYQNFLSENFHFFVVKFSVYLNRHVLAMDNNIIEMKISRILYIGLADLNNHYENMPI